MKRSEGVRVPGTEFEFEHLATIGEAVARRAEILSQMGEWDIAQLVGGKISGRGYGGEIETCVAVRWNLLVLLKNDISFPEEARGNVYTIEPPLVEIDQPPAVPAPWTPPSRSWGPANDQPLAVPAPWMPPSRSWGPANDSQPDFVPTAPREKGESEIDLKPPSYNDALTM